MKIKRASRMLPASERIRRRLRADKATFAANDSIAKHLLPGDLEELELEVAAKMQGVLASLVIDTENDHNTQGTGKRMAKMYLRELFRGRYDLPPPVTDFPNAKSLDELYVVGPVTIRSACSHHLCPIEGQAWVGVIPGKAGRLIGLSKFSRLADWVMSRPQIQEEAIIQLADELENRISPRGLGVVMRCRHGCMTWRGVREHNTMMTTSVMRGILHEAPAARTEFLAMIQGDFQCVG